MNVGDERSKSLWMETDVAPDAPALKSDVTCDTVVVGSGIAGLSTAYELSGLGQEVVVLDRGKIGAGMTARTTAHLAPNPDAGFKAMIDRRGVDIAKEFYQSQAVSIDRIETIQQAESIDCEFRRVDAFLFPGPQTSQDEIDAERDAAKQAGMPVEMANGLPFKGHEQTRCLRYPNVAAFHPTKYLRGLARCITARGGKLYADTAAMEAEEKDGEITLSTEGKPKVRAKYAVIATNSPIVDKYELHTKEAPYRTYAMALELPRGALSDALWWDTLDPYHYVRVARGTERDYVIVGGADHKSGEANDMDVRFDALEAWMRNLVPQLGRVTHRWSGQVLNTIDFSSFTGVNPGSENVYVHTGDSGQGLTHGVVASLIISQAIMGKRALWQKTYAPERKTASALSTFISENVTAVKNFAEYIAPGEVGSYDELKPGEGGIVRDGMKKVAAFRDERGRLHACSAACTHVGCHLHWNGYERCWDCPCHGSQFSIDGEVLNGPAIFPLEKVQAEERKRKAG